MDFDSLDAYIIDGGITHTILRAANTTDPYGCGNPPYDSGWRTACSSLGPYIDHEVEVRFELVLRPDDWYNTWAYIDDVHLVSSCGGGTSLATEPAGYAYVPAPCEGDGSCARQGPLRQ